MRNCFALFSVCLILLCATTTAGRADNALTGKALQEKIAAAFTPEKSTAELAAMALADTGDDNVEKNIKGSAFTRLAERAEQPGEAQALKAKLPNFDAQFRAYAAKHDEWMMRRIAGLLIKLGPPENKLVDYLFATYDGFSLTEFYPQYQKAREKQAIEALQALRGHPAMAEKIAMQLADLADEKLRYSPAVLDAALAILAEYMPKITGAALDQLAAARSRWLNSIPDEAKQRVQNTENAAQNRAHAVTLWDYATAEAVEATKKNFVRTLCLHPTLGKNHRELVTIAHGNGFNQTGAITVLSCPLQ